MRVELDREFRAEGGTAADLDGDGHGDVVVGPYVYWGPDFRERSALWEGEPFDPLRYSDAFFFWPHDLDRDGRLDLLVVGFPGKEAYWYRNPGERDAPWERHLAFERVDNESPAYVDLTGDGEPELVCSTGGAFGWAAPDPADPTRPWTFHPITKPMGLVVFTHGLGVGDVNGDGRADLLEKNGWWEQPASLEGDPHWRPHRFPFSDRRGGAQMLVTDLDGDGDADVVTSLDAHGWGLSWWEQVPRPAGPSQDRGESGAIDFVEHRVMDDEHADSPFGVRFSELHALALADVDGDGTDDVVTGKRWWSHGPEGHPDAGSPAVLYAFLVRRDPSRASGSATLVPLLLDDDSGVGVQVTPVDVDGDGDTDVVVGNKKGAFVIVQEGGAPVPEGRRVGLAPRAADGRALNLDFETGDLADWTAAGEAFADQPIEGDTVAPRRGDASGHAGRFWIGGFERHGDGPTGTLTSAPFVASAPFASFLAGGGADPRTRVELWAKGAAAPFFTATGADHETLQRVVVDLAEHAGSELYVRLVDEHSGGWGHVNFDDLRLHAERPSFARPAGVPELLPPDPIRHAGLAPEAAAAAMTVPDGFRVELVAAEPDLHQPIAMAIDAASRLWVVEAHGYPARRPDGEGADRVLVWSDTDGDGRYDARTVFLEGQNLVSGIAVGHGGVWLGAAPELLFVPDADADLVPDGPPQVLLDGFGYQDTHETLNAFTWGPDGWLYGCHGVFTHSKVGVPGTADAERVPLNAGVWRYHPTRHELEVFAWGTSNPWGIAFDERGQGFVTACVIPHLYHLVQGGRYLRQAGSHFEPWVYEDANTIADHRHWLGDKPHDGNRRSDAAGGGHAHCGALIYRGDLFPERWRGALLMHNVHGNRVNVDHLRPEGSGFVGTHGADLVRANDAWFRGIALETAADGSVYFIDWYDAQACHTNDREVWDRGNGRLYRLAYGDRPAAAVDLCERDDLDLLVLAFGHANAWYADTARLLLAERAAAGTLGAKTRGILADRARTAPTEPARLEALWALHVTGGLDEAADLDLLASEHPYVRAWTVQLLCEDRAAGQELRAELLRLARTDPAPVVRLYVASALQRLPHAERWPVLEALAARAEDADDPNVPLLAWYALAPLVPEDPERALALAAETALGAVRRGVERRAAELPSCHAALVAALAADADLERRARRVRAFAEALADERELPRPDGWSALYRELAADADPEVRADALLLAAVFGDPAAFDALRARLADASEPAAQRGRALDALVRGRDAAVVPVLRALLDEDPADDDDPVAGDDPANGEDPVPDQQPAEQPDDEPDADEDEGARDLRRAAIAALARFDDPATPAALLERWEGFAATERKEALATLAARAPWGQRLLDAVAAGTVARAELTAFVLRKLRDHGDAALDRRLSEVWGVFRDSPEEKRAEIAAWTERLGPEALAAADPAAGRAVYEKTCAACHVLFDAGGDLGPELTGSNRRDLAYLLENMVDPSAVVGADYRSTIVWTTDGLMVAGVVKKETDTTLTIATETERVVLGQDEIEERVLSDVSTMPEGQLATLTETEVRDLVRYLQGDAQVPLPASLEAPPVLFDGATLAGWHGDPAVWSVVDGAIVGRSDGLARNAFLVGEHVLADFRLSLEVLLVDDAGNSGIQLRSRELEHGEVSGYQADVGPGWWGKLYEEHGRGLLWSAPGDAHVRPGEWNTYVIEARGARIRTWLNGEPCVDLEDRDGARAGLLALQVHSGGPTEVRFRGFELELVE